MGSWIERFELSSGSFGVVSSQLPLQYRNNSIVPNVVKILLRGYNVNLLARPATVSVRRGMEGLMDVADEIDQEREVAS